VLAGSEDEELNRLIEIVEGRFLFGRYDVAGLAPDDAGPAWIDNLPEGYLREAAQELSGAAAADPAAAAGLREFSRLWREVGK
jgi:hypothetical protein